jgi:hypothetical protein
MHITVHKERLDPNNTVEIIQSILTSAPAQRLTLISSLDARVRSSTLSILMESVELPDDTRLLESRKSHLLPNAGCVSALLANPQRYGPFVHRLIVTDPLTFSSIDESPSTLLQFEDGAESDLDAVSTPKPNASGIQPMPAGKLVEILVACPNLEYFKWQSTTPPPDGLCEVSPGSPIRKPPL